MEYEKMSTKNQALALSLLTIVILFLMSNSSAVLHPNDKSKKCLLHAGGYAGLTIVGYLFLRYLDLRNQHLNKPAIRDEQTRVFIEALSESQSPAASNALATVALFAALISPGELTTKVLVEAATKAIGENPHAPDATATATAKTDPGCCYGIFFCLRPISTHLLQHSSCV
ncbi:Uncharacterized protein Rs2_35890 [Raphanus sativus]|nr:Uncharacterized protein Rs2_35890 [Raphanus sativus]